MSKKEKKPSYEELVAKVKQLEKKNGSGNIDFRVSSKGGVSVYGLGRFPVTLYYEQWMRLIDKIDDLKKFLKTHKDELSMKKSKSKKKSSEDDDN